MIYKCFHGKYRGFLRTLQSAADQTKIFKELLVFSIPGKNIGFSLKLADIKSQMVHNFIFLGWFEKIQIFF